MKGLKTLIFGLFLVFSSFQPLWGVSSSAGLTLLEAPTARAGGLGGALTAAQNDISAFSYNPASLSSLKKGHASFLFQRDVEEESFGQVSVGTPAGPMAFGLSVGYFDGGEFELFNGVTRRTVKSQEDIVASLGASTKLGRLSVGVTGKYLSSEIGETAKATAWASDIGVQLPLHSRVNLGAAVQNLGTSLTFIEEEERLPRIARVGASTRLFSGLYTTQFLLDFPYFINEEELELALGLEKALGPIAVRAGYQSRRDSNGLSVGAGFLINTFALDYSFGLVNDLNAQHRISLSTRFSGKKPIPAFVQTKGSDVYRLPVNSKRLTPSFYEMQGEVFTATLGVEQVQEEWRYEVQAGETFQVLADRYYGDVNLWEVLYEANKDNVLGPNKLKGGDRIVIP